MTKTTKAKPKTRKKAKSKSASQKESRQPSVVRINAEDLPRRTIEESLEFPKILHGTFAGQSASWEEIAKILGVAASNPQNKYPLWAAEAYGLIKRENDGTFSLAEKDEK